MSPDRVKTRKGSVDGGSACSKGYLHGHVKGEELKIGPRNMPLDGRQRTDRDKNGDLVFA